MTDKELMEQFQMIMGAIDSIDKKVDAARDELREEINASETRTKIFIENSVTKKIESLFDGINSPMKNNGIRETS
jgi:hypothetical protein